MIKPVVKFAINTLLAKTLKDFMDVFPQYVSAYPDMTTSEICNMIYISGYQVGLNEGMRIITKNVESMISDTQNAKAE